MNQGRRADTALDRLPGEVVDWLTKPLASFLRIEAGAGAILLAVTIAALILSNSPWAHQFPRFWELPVGIRIGSLETARSLRDWINDALMTLFVFVVALELKLSPVERLEIMLLTVGKPLGVITFSWLAVRSGIAIRPPSLDWGMLAGGACLPASASRWRCSLQSWPFSGDHIDAAKLGILSASVVSAVLGTALLVWLSSSRRVTIR